MAFLAWICAENEKVLSHECVACPFGKTNLAGDDATGPDTMCGNIYFQLDVFQQWCAQWCSRNLKYAEIYNLLTYFATDLCECEKLYFDYRISNEPQCQLELYCNRTRGYC